MARRWLTVTLTLALAASIGLNIYARRSRGRPALEYFPNMARTVRAFS